MSHIAFIVLWVLCPMVGFAQWAGSTSMSMDANNSETCYVSNGTWSICWDNTYLYLYKSGGNSSEPAIVYFDIDPVFPVTWGTDNDGNVTGKVDYGITTNNPFRADLRIFWPTATAPEYETRTGSGTWTSSSTTLSSGNYAVNGSIRELRIAWASFPGLSSRPDRFNFFGFATSTASPGFMYDQTPGDNPAGAYASPYIEYYWRCNNTSSSATHNPFQYKCYTYLGTGGNLGYIADIHDFTLNKNGVTINKSGKWVALGYLALSDGTIEFDSNSDSLQVEDSLVIMGTGNFLMENSTGKVWIKKTFVQRSSNTAYMSSDTARLIISGNFRNETSLETRNTKVDFYEFKSTPVSQTLSGNLSGSNSFMGVEVNNSAGIIFQPSDSVAIRDYFIFSLGKVSVVNGKYLKFRNGVQVTNTGGPTSGKFVDGKLARQLDQSGDSVFHVGKGSVMARCAIHPSATSSDRVYIVEYQDNGHIYNSNYSATRISGSGLDHTSYVEYWNIECNKSGAEDDAWLTLHWTSNSITSANSSEREDIRVARWQGGTTNLWAREGDTPTINNISQNEGSVKANITTSDFSDQVFTIGSNTNPNPLPVTMLHFSANRLNRRQNLLEWETASEYLCAGYEIYRSEGSEFRYVDYVSSLKSTTYEMSRYRYTDEITPGPNHYYKIRQLDFDGKETWYGPVMTLGNPELSYLISPIIIAPGEVLNVNSISDELKTIELAGTDGRLIQKLDIKNPVIPRTAAGIYIIRMQTFNNENLYKKIIISD